MSKTFGYCRVSTLDQDTALQEDALRAAYEDITILQEKASGTSMQGREMLTLILNLLGKGDKLVVWKLDRLARNLNDLTSLVQQIEDKGASLEILDQRIDTSTASGKAFLQMLGVFAEFETNIRRERQMAGVAQAKAQGKYKGRPKGIDADEVKKLRDSGLGATEIAKRLGIGRASVYRLLANDNE